MGIIRVSSVFVLQSDVERFLAQLLDSGVRSYLNADGLLTIIVLRRSLVAYAEIMLLSTWQSDKQMKNVFESGTIVNEGFGTGVVSVRTEPPNVYDLVIDVSNTGCGPDHR